MYFGLPPGIDTTADRDCGYGLALPALSPADRQRLVEILATRPALTTGGVAPGDPRATQLATELGQRREPAAWLVAGLLLSPPGTPQPSLPPAREQLRRVEQATPVSDPIGARARLALADLEEGEPANLLRIRLLSNPLGWATLEALLSLGDGLYQTGETGRALGVFTVVAARTPDARTEAAARVWAARMGIEIGQHDRAFGHLTVLLRSPTLVGALVPMQRDSLVVTASRAVGGLPPAALDVLATWPAGLAAEIAEQAECSQCGPGRLGRLASIITQAGHPWTPRDTPAPQDREDGAAGLVQDCAVDLGVSFGTFDLSVSVFSAGPPEVRVRGPILPAFGACLSQRAERHLGAATAGITARVTLDAILAGGAGPPPGSGRLFGARSLAKIWPWRALRPGAGAGAATGIL